MAFPTTQWSLFAAASAGSERDALPALNELCRRYREPVLYFFRSRVASPEDAEDLTQNLFVQMLNRRTWLQAEAGKGRFRCFLTVIAGNALRNWVSAGKTARRGHAVNIASLDLLRELGKEPAAPEDATVFAFDREWAVSVVSAAWEGVRQSFSASDGERRFDVLRRFLPGSESPPTCELAAELLDTTVGNVRTLIHRLRDTFRVELRRCVADTLISPSDLDEEMDYLHSILVSDSISFPKPTAKKKKKRSILKLFVRNRPVKN